MWTGQLKVADGFQVIERGHAVHRFCYSMENLCLLFFCAEEANCSHGTLSVPLPTLRNESVQGHLI